MFNTGLPTTFSIIHGHIIKDPPAPFPPIPQNRKLGEPCGSCFCPPTYTEGDCEPGLECKHDKRLADAPGRCVEQGKFTDLFCI